MNTAVWILMILNSGSHVVPGPEFDTKAKCEAAAGAIKKGMEETRWGLIFKTSCIRIEK